MKRATTREFGGRAAQLHDPVELCREDHLGRHVVAGVVVAIDEAHDAPLILDLYEPGGRPFLCSAPPQKTHPVHHRLGGEFFVGADLSEMQPGQWTWARAPHDAPADAPKGKQKR